MIKRPIKKYLNHQRRDFLKTGSFGLAMLLGGRHTFVANAMAQGGRSQLSGRIIGLTTRSDGINPDYDTSEIITLDLSGGDYAYTALDDYQQGHSLVALPDGGYFAVPYGMDDNPCLFLNSDFSISAEVFAPRNHGFGGHAVLLPDNKTIFTHFNVENENRARPAEATGQRCLIDIGTKTVIEAKPSEILHGHDMIVTRDAKTLVFADDGNIETPFPDNHPYNILSYKPALHLYDAKTLEKQKTIVLPVNGSLVHIEEGEDGRIYGGAEQFINRDDRGIALLNEAFGEQAIPYLESITHDYYQEEVPLPGPFVGVNLQSQEVSSTISIEHSDPFDIRLNQNTGLLFSAYTSSNQLARYDGSSQTMSYISTSELNIADPYGLIEIPGTSLMVINGFDRGISVFDAQTMALVRNFDVPTYGMKHMLFAA